MKKFFFTILFLQSFVFLYSQQNKANYDESKIPAYNLPDPLIFNNGSRVTSKEDWIKRRNELYKTFENEVYGIAPQWKGKIIPTEISSDLQAMNGKAIRKEINLKLKNGNKELNVTLLVYLPNSAGPVPVFLGYNFGGNHSVTDEPGISIPTSWMRNDEEDGVSQNKGSEKGRGKSVSQWQVSELLSRGYGLVTLYYGDIDPDFDDGFTNGVHGLYDQKPDQTSWGSVAAWAWGLSRVMDWMETYPSIDSKKVIVIGHSRLGKTALWAGASDTRFAMVISNNSGCGGAALSKRIYGETVGIINTAFPHWFCNNFNKYNEKEAALPVDQHELLAIIAPRPVYVASAEDDQWADPKGEFLACVNASPVYVLLGCKGFPADKMPPVNSPVIGAIGYHIRTGGHDVKLYDWQQYLEFADSHLKNR
ncbi:MAG: acetylxylan esterase [Bacteroidales bacterium]|nr:acetylxylan esterase [Bacteroidales bacterium]